jgi:hypothetical protein
MSLPETVFGKMNVGYPGLSSLKSAHPYRAQPSKNADPGRPQPPVTRIMLFPSNKKPSF